jgi:hypothetical protein
MSRRLDEWPNPFSASGNELPRGDDASAATQRRSRGALALQCVHPPPAAGLPCSREARALSGGAVLAFNCSAVPMF